MGWYGIGKGGTNPLGQLRVNTFLKPMAFTEHL